LRFPGFMGEWEVKKLGEVAEFSKGKGISKIDIEESGETECIRYGELYTHYGEVITEIKSKTNILKANLVLSEVNDVIIPSSGETAIDIATASCVLKSGVALGGDLNIIKTSNNGIFLSYYLNSKKKMEIASLAQGSSVVHLYSSQLVSLDINFPPLSEQDQISSLLSLIDERISTQNKIIEELKLLKATLAQNIFSQQLRFKDDNGMDFPDWKVKKLSEVCEIVMGQSPSSISYNTEEIGVPLIQGNADIFNRITSPRNWTTEITKECQIGHLILTVRAPVGAVAKSAHNACIGRGVCAIKGNSNNSNEFIYQFLLDYEDKWNKLEQGSTFTAVSGNEIKKVGISIPCLEAQTKIANFLSSIDEKIEIERRILVQLETQKKYLLSNLFI
jgi:type I restriction enzyme S subunit